MTDLGAYRAGLFSLTRRGFLKATAGWLTGLTAIGVGSYVLHPSWASAAEPIKVGLATDLSGFLSFVGPTHVAAAKIIVEDINASGGLLSRPLELHIEDTATNEATGVSAARKLVQRNNVDIMFGGVASSMRNAIKDIIVKNGKKLYIYAQLYEGTECTPNLFCTGPTPPQQCDELVPWLIKNGGARFALLGANYVWPVEFHKYSRKVVEASGGEVVYQEFFPLDQAEYGAAVNKIRSEKVDVVFTLLTGGQAAFLKQLHEAGFLARGGRLCCPWFDHTAAGIAQPAEFEGLASCFDYFLGVDDPATCGYDTRLLDAKVFSGSGGSTGIYRGMYMWANSVAKVGSLDANSVAAAMDGAKLGHGPGGPSEMVPGKRHVKMNMYIAVAKSGKFDVIRKSDGLVDPKAC